MAPVRRKNFWFRWQYVMLAGHVLLFQNIGILLDTCSRTFYEQHAAWRFIFLIGTSIKSSVCHENNKAGMVMCGVRTYEVERFHILLQTSDECMNTQRAECLQTF